MTTLPTWNRVPLKDIPDFDSCEAYLAHYASVMPGGEACVDLGGERYTHAALYQRVQQLKHGLLAQGIQPGDRVATLSVPHSNAWISFLAAASTGAVWVGLNPRYTRDELGYVIEDAQPKIILAAPSIGDRSYLDDLKAIAPDQFGAQHIYLYGEAQEGFQSVATLHSDDKAEPQAFNTDAPCLLVYTSGTTGKPKGALLKQSGLLACSRVQAHHYGSQRGRALNPLPINHVGAVCDTGTTLLVSGSTQVFVDDFDPERINKAFGEEKITNWGGIPTMFQLQMSHPSFQDMDRSHVRRIMWSGAPMPIELAKKLAHFGLPMHNFYGMTETTGSICFTAPDAQIDELVNTVGRPEPSYDVRIADHVSEKECGIGEVGEIQVRGPGVFASYLNRPEATAKAFNDDGWLKTGDLASKDDAGCLRLSGRLKEMFKSGGYNVYPNEVEAALERLEGITTAVVVSVPDPLFHEVGHAFVQAEPGKTWSAQTFKSVLSSTLANYKIPKYFTLTDDFPMLPIGKVDRQLLKQQASGA